MLNPVAISNWSFLDHPLSEFNLHYIHDHVCHTYLNESYAIGHRGLGCSVLNKYLRAILATNSFLVYTHSEQYIEYRKDFKYHSASFAVAITKMPDIKFTLYAVMDDSRTYTLETTNLQDILSLIFTLFYKH